MKRFKMLMIGMVGLIFMGLISCEKETKILDKSIDGTYVGEFINSNTLKSVLDNPMGDSATAIITMMDSTQIKFHCYGSNFDSTLILNMFDDDDSMYVCLTGNDFNHEYGHMMGYGNGMMGNGMGMGNGHMMTDTTTKWGKHLYNDHKPGDMHFGGFNMMDHTFDYAFKMMNGNAINYMHFHGKKK
jgi:hypothetical protein